MSDMTYSNFKEFYPFYLSQHKNKVDRCLHYFGSINAIVLLAYFIFTKSYSLIPLVLIQGYLFAWIGHFVFEKNIPATFKYPRYSFMGDWCMLKDAIIKRKL